MDFGSCCQHKETRRSTQDEQHEIFAQRCKVQWGSRWDFGMFIVNCKRSDICSSNIPQPECIACCPAPGLRQPATKASYTIDGNYLLTPWSRVLLEKLTGLQLVKKFAAFYGTRRFITALTSLRHPSLSWASPIQSTCPQPTTWRSILILSTHLSLGLPSGLFSSGFPTRTLHAPISSPIRTTCPAHLGVQEVRWDKEGTVRVRDYNFFYGKGNENHRR